MDFFLLLAKFLFVVAFLVAIIIGTHFFDRAKQHERESGRTGWFFGPVSVFLALRRGNKDLAIAVALAVGCFVAAIVFLVLLDL